MISGNDYKEIGNINLSEDKKLGLTMQVMFLLILAVGVGIILFLRIGEKNIFPTWLIVLFCLAYIVVHECIHVAAMKLFSKENIKVKFKFPTISVGSAFLFSKTQFAIIAIAPVAVLGLILFVCLALMPKGIFLLCILLTLNFAGASGDFLQIYLARKFPENSYFQDDSEITKVYLKADED